MKLVTSAQMRQIDRQAIDHQGVPSDQLMENAGQGIAWAMLDDLIIDPSATTVAVFCGKGNNGGDGFVIARYLHEAGVDVSLFFLGPPDKLSADAALNFKRATTASVQMTEIISADDLPRDLESDFIIDAIFGTGFSGAPRGLTAELIEFINDQDAEIIAVDVPSGLNADDGQHEGQVVDADYTFTLAQPKYGLYLSPGRELAGAVNVVPIGLPDNLVNELDLPNELVTSELIVDLLPERKPDGHKGDFGKLFLLSGSTGLTGAATLATQSAIRAGCGLVRLGCPHSVQPVLAIKLTEATTYPLPDVKKRGKLALRGLGEIRKLISENDAIVIGPGVGLHHETGELIRRLLSGLDKPSIIDADAITALVGHAELLKGCSPIPIITPHAGEFKRLTGREVPGDILERTAIVRDVAKELGVVLVLKGSPTLTAAPDSACYLNPTGNHGMATGGSGDVLSGLIGSFLAQGLSPLNAAILGVYLHGLAGDIAADIITPRALIAGDMIECLPEVFELLE